MSVSVSVHVGNYLVELNPVAFIPILLFAAVIVISAAAIVRILQRAGHSGWWTLIAFVPVLNIVALWYFGFGPWPALNSKIAASN
jgi:hypothetical protein